MAEEIMVSVNLHIFSGLSQRKGDDKCRTLAGPAACRDRPAMALCDLSADGKPYACSLILVSAVQPLEGTENSVEILFIESDSVIFHKNPDYGAFSMPVDLYNRLLMIPAVLHAVAYEIRAQLLVGGQ